MRGEMGILKQKRTLLMSAMFAVLAFVLMVFLCYLFMSNTVHSHLVQHTMNLLDYGQAIISSTLKESEITLNGFSRSVRNMILRGENADGLRDYLNDFYNSQIAKKEDSFIKNIYCYFETLPDGPVFLSGSAQHHLSNDDPKHSLWYLEAVASKGAVVELLSNEEEADEETILTYALSIYDDNGQRLGVVCVDVRVSVIGKNIVKTASDRRGFGMLLTKDLILLAHFNPRYIGKSLRDPEISVSIFADDLLNGKEVFERSYFMYGQPSVAFFKTLSNGWYLGIIIPEGPYYKSVTNMALILFVLGTVFASVLVFGLVRIDMSREKSDAANLQKSSFLANMSHEIRTPMNAILGISKIQLQDKTLTGSAREAISMMHDSGELLLSIINDILDLSRIEADKFELAPVKYEIASLINDTMMLNMARLGSKPIEFKLLVDENIPSTLFGDELRIGQVLNNLLSNAFKYTKNGSVTLSVSLNKKMEDEESDNVKLIFKVTDTGIGMTEEQIVSLFDEYSRFNMEANRATQGTGLGMSITKNLLHMMSGDISVTSTMDVGTEFVVSIPQKKIGSNVLGKDLAEKLQMFRVQSVKQIKNAQIIIEPMPYGRILIVDDVESNLYVARGLMKSYELNIDTATSGYDAINRIKEGNVYDIVFMDHMMPNMDGIEATKIIRKLGYEHPIVALTANAVVGQSDMFLSNGFDGFVSKPIDVRELNSVLKEFVRDVQPPEVIEAARRKRAAKSMNESTPDEMEILSINKELAEVFARDASKAIAILEAINEKQGIYGEDDIKSYIITVHGMKSSLANLGELELSAVAAKLEKAGREQNIELISTKTSDFLNNLRALTVKLKTLEEDNDEEDVTEDLLYLRERLLTIQGACSTYDKRIAKDAITELRQRKWSAQNKEQLAKISEYLLISDFDQAAGVAENLIKKQLIIA